MKLKSICGVETPRLIRTALIKDKPGPYCMSFGFEPDVLTESIKRIGLINPLIITNGDDNRYIVVAGYRRLMALKYLNIHDVYCIDLSESGMSSLELLLLNLYDNLTTRLFNDVEKGMILSRLSEYVSQKIIIKEFMPLLKISRNNNLDLYLEIDKLGNHIKYLLTNGNLSLRALKLMLGLDNESREALCYLIENIKPNLNYQCYLIEYLIDISQKENLHIRDILEEEPYKSILNDKQTNNPQKSKKLLKLFWTRKYPDLNNSIKQFNKSIAGLNLPDKIKIDHPPYFEAADYKLELLFANGNELLKNLEILSKRKAELKGLKDPW